MTEKLQYRVTGDARFIFRLPLLLLLCFSRYEVALNRSFLSPARHPGRPPAWARTPWPPPSPGCAGEAAPAAAAAAAAAGAAVRLEAARRSAPAPLSKPKLIALAAAAAVGRGPPSFHRARRQDNVVEVQASKQASKHGA